MFTFTADEQQLRKALKEIERAKRNGFNYCLAVFELAEYGQMIEDRRIEYDDLVEKAHPTNGNLNWGRGQRITERYRFQFGKLIPVSEN